MVTKEFVVEPDRLKYVLKGGHGSYTITKFVFGDIVDVKTRATRQGWHTAGICQGSCTAYHPLIGQCLKTMQQDIGYELTFSGTAAKMLEHEVRLVNLTEEVLEMEKERLRLVRDGEARVKAQEKVQAKAARKASRKAEKAEKEEEAAPPAPVDIAAS